MQLTLIVPELVWPEPDDRQTLDAAVCPALSALLTRSPCERRTPQSLEATLADAFGLPPGAPYAAFRLLGEPQAASFPAKTSRWVCADPVHLRFHQERIILADNRHFGIALAEAQALAGELNRHFGDIGTFHVASAERWYLALAETAPGDGFARFDVPPLSAVAGRRVDRQLPETQDNGWLRKLLNEAQMIMHGHPVNAAREAEGRPAINSLWLWGAGSLPERRASGLGALWSTQPLAIGLARAAGLPVQPVPQYPARLLAQAAPDSHQLVVLDNLLDPVQYEDGEAYVAALETLEKHWFAPLKKALISGRLTRLRIASTTAYGLLAWECTRREQWKFWQRPESLAALAQNLAKGSP